VIVVQHTTAEREGRRLDILVCQLMALFRGQDR